PGVRAAAPATGAASRMSTRTTTTTASPWRRFTRPRYRLRGRLTSSGRRVSLPAFHTNPERAAALRTVDADTPRAIPRARLLPAPPRSHRVTFDIPRASAQRADQTTVRRANLGVVLQHVAAHGPCSRARVAAETGLTRGTVSSLVAELVELELLHETGDGRDG